ncbi:hypothetical protein [Methylomonas sp.]|uniref:hypothetical protein n=1 Tax=Methylomonas sp. TaxID=418 RepID=UPI0025DC1614|nr:hypothetical protein [Methylomonas sp.]
MIEDFFLDRLSTIYGITGKGKTTMIVHILKILQPFIYTGVVFSPTDVDNGNYSRSLFPPALIHKTLSREALESIWKRQTESMEIYQIVNNLSILDGFARKCGITAQELAAIRECDVQLENALRKLDKKDTSYSATSDRLREHVNNAKIKIYKNVIRSRARMLPQEVIQQMTNDERIVADFLDFNPRIIIVFDDCSTELQHLRKLEVVSDLFFKGRQKKITVLLALHSDKCIESEQRLNTGGAKIFIDDATARRFVDKETNAVSPEIAREVLRLCKINFVEGSYKKILITLDGRVLTVQANTYEPFSFVSNEVRQAIEQIQKKGDERKSSGAIYRYLQQRKR